MTSNRVGLPCDGCGQAASNEHIDRRLRRLEWSTRYRPVHINNLFLAAFSPYRDGEFLYAPGGEWGGEAKHLLRAVGISVEEKSREAVLAEFQRAGFFLTHVLECPLGEDASDEAVWAILLKERVRAVVSRLRRSLKPKRVTMITEALQGVAQDIAALDLGCPVILNDGKPFALSEQTSEAEFSLLREKLAGAGNG